uniref:Putative secreted protein n=1 Tax=Anopheles marajoara TaxID=58244 RepID=A0A2M4C8F4_9DIPT
MFWFSFSFSSLFSMDRCRSIEFLANSVSSNCANAPFSCVNSSSPLTPISKITSRSLPAASLASNKIDGFLRTSAKIDVCGAAKRCNCAAKLVAIVVPHEFQHF